MSDYNYGSNGVDPEDNPGQVGGTGGVNIGGNGGGSSGMGSLGGMGATVHPTQQSGTGPTIDGTPTSSLTPTTAGRQGVAEGSWIPYQDFAGMQNSATSGLLAPTSTSQDPFQQYTRKNLGAPAQEDKQHSDVTMPNPVGTPQASSGGMVNPYAGVNQSGGGFAGSMLVAGPGPGGYYGDPLSNYLKKG